MSKVDIFCHGVAKPAHAAYAVLLRSGERQRLVSERLPGDVNGHQAALQGLVAGLRLLRRPCELIIYCDLPYIVRYARLTTDRRAGRAGLHRVRLVKYLDLWAQLWELCEPHVLKFDYPQSRDERHWQRCCRAATKAAKRSSPGPRPTPPRAPPAAAARRPQRDKRLVDCEYGKCLGGRTPSGAPRLWKARILIDGPDTAWLVCEHCASLLINELREKGIEPVRSVLP